MKTIYRNISFLILLVLSTPLVAQFSTEAIKYTQFLNFLNKYYVDSVNTEKIVEEAIISQLRELDPHSIYISPEDVKKMNEPLEGNFEGIGIQFNILKDTLFVVASIPGGPSESVGIKAGDRIIEVDGENIAGTGITNDDVFRLLRGKKGTEVSVGILRRYVDEIIHFTITRDKIPINSLDAAYMAADSVAYIKLNRFAITTMDEFMNAADTLKAQGAKDLILDLRGNAGGYLETAVQLADQILANGELIVYTRGINSFRREYFAHKPGIFESGKVAILIDEGSASASEIVAGAIQDWDRGLIIGRRSFGKGLVQSRLKMTDGAEIRLTTARYYTPTGRLIQKPYEDSEDYQSEIYTRYENGEFMNSDSIHFPDSLMYTTLMNGRIVFGGGGIMPDIFVPLDTLDYTDLYSDLSRQGIINQFALTFVDKNRRKINNRYKNFDQFKEEYMITADLLNELAEYAREEGLEVDPSELEKSSEKISILLKSYIARDIWTTSEFYEIINEDSEPYLKALRVLNEWEHYGAQILN